MSESDQKNCDPERESLVDKHGFDAVMKGLLSVPPDAVKNGKPKNGKAPNKQKRTAKK